MGHLLLVGTVLWMGQSEWEKGSGSQFSEKNIVPGFRVLGKRDTVQIEQVELQYHP